MRYRVLSEMTVDTPEGVVHLKQGQIIELSEGEAITFIQEDLITPNEPVAYKIAPEISDVPLWVVEGEEDREKLRAEGITEPIYTVQEIRSMRGLPREAVIVIHRIKEVFPEASEANSPHPWNPTEEFQDDARD